MANETWKFVQAKRQVLRYCHFSAAGIRSNRTAATLRMVQKENGNSYIIVHQPPRAKPWCSKLEKAHTQQSGHAGLLSESR